MIFCVFGRTPTKQGRAEGQPLPPPLAVGPFLFLFLLWLRSEGRYAVAVAILPRRVLVAALVLPHSRFLISELIQPAASGLQGASHALWTSLGSCALRIGHCGLSCFLGDLCERGSFDLVKVVVVGVLA